MMAATSAADTSATGGGGAAATTLAADDVVGGGGDQSLLVPPQQQQQRQPSSSTTPTPAAAAAAAASSQQTPILRVGFQSHFGGLYDFDTQRQDHSVGLRMRKFLTTTNKVHVFGLPTLNINWSSRQVAPGCQFQDCIRKWFNPATARAVYAYNENHNENHNENNETVGAAAADSGGASADSRGSADSSSSSSSDKEEEENSSDKGHLPSSSSSQQQSLLLQYGGTALIGREIAALRFVMSSKDFRKLGRYVVQTFSGKCTGKFLQIVMVHVPSSSSSSSKSCSSSSSASVYPNLSAYEQQSIELKKKKKKKATAMEDSTDCCDDNNNEPRTQLMMDLKSLVEKWQQNGDEILIMMDFDKDIDNNNNDDDDDEEGGGGGGRQDHQDHQDQEGGVLSEEEIYETFTAELGLDDIIISQKKHINSNGDGDGNGSAGGDESAGSAAAGGGYGGGGGGGGYIFASPTIDVVKCGRTASQEESIDGRGPFVWADVDATSVFGNAACQTCNSGVGVGVGGGGGGGDVGSNSGSVIVDSSSSNSAAIVTSSPNESTTASIGDSTASVQSSPVVVVPTTVAVGPQYWLKKQREFERVVQVTDRTFRLRTYPKVFVGCEVVDALIANTVVDNREDAVRLVQNLQSQISGGKYFHHVVDSDAHPKFEDEYLFYRFFKDDNDDENNDAGNSRIGCDEDVNSNSNKSSVLDASTKSSVSMASQQSSSSSPTANGGGAAAGACPFDFQVDCHLLTKARSFVEHADVEDRFYRLKTYKGVFVGTEMVDSLIYYGICRSRDEAVELGRALQAQPYNLFTCVLQTSHPASAKRNGGPETFSDEFNFYKFNDEKIRMMNGEGGVSDCGCDAIMDETAYELVTATDNVSNTIDLKEMSDKFLAFADVRHRRYRFRLYKDVFVGCELCDKLVETGVATTRSEAVQLGRQLQKDMGLFKHVCDEHLFADEWYFYRFTNRSKKNGGRHMTLKEKMRSKRNV